METDLWKAHWYPAVRTKTPPNYVMTSSQMIDDGTYAISVYVV